MGIAIWLLPHSESRVFNELKKLIDENAKKHNRPSFAPHITFATIPDSANVDKIDLALSELKETLTSMHVKFTKLKRGSTFFQSVYVKLDDTSSAALLALQHKFYTNFEIESAKVLPEFAHLSLFYGETVEERNDVMTGLTGEPATSSYDWEVDAKFIDDAQLGEMWIVECKGPVSDWKTLRKYRYETG